MPTLLKSNAAEGAAMGLNAHVADLNRRETARQNDLNRYDKAKKSRLDLIALMADPKSRMSDQMTNPITGEGTTLWNMGNDIVAQGEDFAYQPNFMTKDDKGNAFSQLMSESVYGNTPARKKK